MFGLKNERNVYVIGAGASKEVNLPTGAELIGKIGSLLNFRFDFGSQKSGDYLIIDAIKRYSKNQNIDPNRLVEAGVKISKSLHQAISIDNYIDAHRDNEFIAHCGKLAIVRSILTAEQNSRLHVDRYQSHKRFLNFEQLGNTWYNQFFKIITENCHVDDLPQRLKNITLVIFNYDRCIEHYLFHALINYYHIDVQDAAALMSEIEIHHPYGSIGPLPYLRRPDSVEFGAEINAEELLSLAQSIKTFSEGADPDSSDIIQIKRSLSKAEKLVFIGFAFHKLNLQLIAPRSDNIADIKAVKCYATSLGISASDQQVVKSQIEEMYEGNIVVEMTEKPGNEFFQEYWRSLAF